VKVVKRLPAKGEVSGLKLHCDTQLQSWVAHLLQCLGQLSLPPSEERYMSINLMVE